MVTSAGQLTYCTNIHPGESWEAHFKALQTSFPIIKAALSPNAPMGIGLRLSNEASLALIGSEKLAGFREWMEENQAYVFTMNGFPYGGFHHTRVKDQVHAPDWTTRERVDYTIRLFHILEQILPENMDGGILRLPYPTGTGIPRRLRWLLRDNRPRTTCSKWWRSWQGSAGIPGKLLHLDVEPEPDGMLETGTEYIEWFEKDLLPAGIPYISGSLGVSEKEAASIIREHLRLCYDVCHFAIGYEPHGTIVSALAEKGLKIGKIQISAALKSNMGSHPAERGPLKDAFAKYNEPVYLHQVVARTEKGELLRYRDLDEALADYQNPQVREWRAHFHVPVFEKDFGLLQSTRDDIREVLEIQQTRNFTNHMEVETYTWEVLDPSLKLPLQESIIRELQWVKRQLD